MKPKSILCCVMSAVLALGVSPTSTLAATANTSSSASAATTLVQIEGTEGIDYAEGEVIVAVRGGKDALEAETATSSTAQLFGMSSNQAGSSPISIDSTLTCVSASDVTSAADELDASGNVSLETDANGSQQSSSADD